MLDLNTRLCVGWKTLPNLKFKLKFQTQISNSNLNSKKLKSSLSSRVIQDSGKFTPRVKETETYCHVDAHNIWEVTWYFLPWRPFSAVARGRKLCILIPVCLVLAFVGLCWVDQVCGRRLIFLVLCRRRGYFSWGYWCPCWCHWQITTPSTQYQK